MKGNRFLNDSAAEEVPETSSRRRRSRESGTERFSDLSEADKALQESDTRFREMADGLPQLVWVHGQNGEQELVNQTFCEYFGVDRTGMQGLRWQSLLHPDDVESYTRQFEESLAQRTTFHAQARAKRADGEWRWLESWGKPRFSAEGRFRGYVGTSTDITEKKVTEAALRESEQRFRTLADNIAQLAWMADKAGQIFWYNKRWYDFTGTTSEQMLGNGWEKIPHPDWLGSVKAKYLHCIETGEPWDDIFPMRGKDGNYRWFLSRALPTRNEAGEIVRWLGTNTDITEQREVEELLRESDQRKDEYMAMLGHELRNPLAAIGAATDLAKLAQPSDPRLRHAISVLERQSRYVSRIVDGLLDFSRMAQGKIELELQPTDIAELLRTVMKDRAPHLEKRGLTLIENYPDERLWVTGDWVRLVQVFDNLMGNAIKFTEAGGRVTVSVVRSGPCAEIRIADTGVGIRREMLLRVFEPFLQEEQDVSRTAGGLGLGLALAKSLVELQHGSIEAHSHGVGQGAELVVRLPLTTARSSTWRPQPLRQPRNKRVLIVEDNTDAADTLKTLLQLKGHSATVARSGCEALNLLAAEDADVVLCDIGLPGMSGYEFAREVRGSGNFQRLTLIAMTGYGQPEDRKRSMQAGFDDHLTKPVRIEVLDEILSRVA